MLRFFLFMGCVMATSTIIAGVVSSCPADLVPIQIASETRVNPVSTLSAAGLSDFYPDSGPVITAVTKHVAARLSKDKLCLDNPESKKRSLMQFVRWPLNFMKDRPFITLALPPTESPAGGCRLSSPWIDLIFERRPVPSLRAVVRLNHRQVLADQAILSGAINVPGGVAMPLETKEYMHFAGSYADSEIRGNPASKPIEERMPPDVLWLFRRSWQTTTVPFPSDDPVANAVNKSAVGYTKLVTALIDQCLDSYGADIHYHSILEVADLISLEQYKITTPIR